MKMNNDPFLPLYFYGLYPVGEQDKIDLCSPTFYKDAMNFYSKKADEDERKKLLQGIKYLSYRITQYDELINVITTWESEERLIMVTRELFFRQIPNLVKEFRMEVSNIMEATREKLSERMNKERKERNRLKEVIKNKEIQIDSLIISKKVIRATPPPTGFQSSLIDKQIEKLFDQMQTYIDSNPVNFKAIFKNEPLPPSFIPIKRKKIFTSSLCAYFVSELFQKDNPGDYWSIAENCFDAKGLRQLLHNAFQFNNSQKPRGHKEIDSILKNIYTPLQ